MKTIRLNKSRLYHDFHFVIFQIAFMMIPSDQAFAQWQQSVNLKGGIVYTLAANDSGIFAGTDTGGVFLSVDKGLNWTALNNGLTNKNVKALLMKDNLIVAGIANGLSTGATFTSWNNGVSWAAPATPYYGFLFCLALNGTDILAGTWYGVIKSSDNGSTWTTLANGLPSNAGVAGLAISGTKIFAGVSSSSADNTGVFLSTNGGSSWLERNNGLNSLVVNTIAARDSSIFAATDTAGVFLSSNSGSNWTSINAGLTNKFVNTFKVRGSHILAGTQDGIFLYSDSMNSWTNISANIPMGTSVHSIEMMDGYLYAGTTSAVWRRSLGEVISGVDDVFTDNNISVYPVPADEWLTINFPGNNNSLKYHISDLSGREILNEWESNHNHMIHTASLQNGVYFLTIEVEGSRVSRRKILIAH